MDITFFGRHCRFSADVLAALLKHGHRPRLIILPGKSGASARVVQSPAGKPRLPLTPVGEGIDILPTISSLAWSSGAKVAEVSRDQLDSIPNRYREFSKCVAVSACYPWLLPAAVLDQSQYGAFNVHPSLLPAHRGPDPIFWTLHAGDRVSGATIHRMTGQLDAGPTVAQEATGIPLRTRYRDLEQRTIALGARLLCEILDRLEAGSVRSTQQAYHDPEFETYPRRSDFQISTEWNAERAFRFVYGVSGTSGHVTIHPPTGAPIRVDDAVVLHSGRNQNVPLIAHAGVISIQFADGVVDFIPSPEPMLHR